MKQLHCVYCKNKNPRLNLEIDSVVLSETDKNSISKSDLDIILKGDLSKLMLSDMLEVKISSIGSESLVISIREVK